MRKKLRAYTIAQLKTMSCFYSCISNQFVSGATVYRAYLNSNEAGTFYDFLESDNSAYIFI